MGVRVQLSRYRHIRNIRNRGTRGFTSKLSLVLLLCFLAASIGCQSFVRTGGPSQSPGRDKVLDIIESGRLRVGMSGTQPPLNMISKSGELMGLDVELARALADAMRLDLVLIRKPFRDLLSGLEDDEYDLVISSLTITPARNARVAFAGPYMISGAALLTRKALIPELADIDALDTPDRTWGALDGSTSEELIQEAFPNAKLVVSDDLQSLVPMIASGEIDGLIGDLPYVQFEMARRPGDDLAVLPQPFTTEPLGIALPPNSPLFSNLVQNYLNTLEYTGLLMQMKADWLQGGEWLSEMP